MNLMKIVKFSWFALFVGAMVMCFVTIFPRTCRAERTMSLKDGTLVVHAEVMRVHNVPREITDPDIAFKFLSGQLKEARVAGKGKTTFLLSFPWIKLSTEYPQFIVAYRGAWSVDSKPSRFTEDIDLLFTILGLWMPIIFILVVNMLYRIAIKKPPEILIAMPVVFIFPTLLTTLTGGGWNYKFALHYCLFLIVVYAVSFGLAWLVGKLVGTAKALYYG